MVGVNMLLVDVVLQVHLLGEGNSSHAFVDVTQMDGLYDFSRIQVSGIRTFLFVLCWFLFPSSDNFFFWSKFFL